MSPYRHTLFRRTKGLHLHRNCMLNDSATHAVKSGLVHRTMEAYFLHRRTKANCIFLSHKSDLGGEQWTNSELWGGEVWILRYKLAIMRKSLLDTNVKFLYFFIPWQKQAHNPDFSSQNWEFRIVRYKSLNCEINWIVRVAITYFYSFFILFYILF